MPGASHLIAFVMVEEDEPEAVLDDVRVLCEEARGSLVVPPVECCGPGADDGRRTGWSLRLRGACSEGQDRCL
jgi:hypothetical protein